MISICSQLIPGVATMSTGLLSVPLIAAVLLGDELALNDSSSYPVSGRRATAVAESETGADTNAQQELADGEALIWYLGHAGWAVRTRSRLLIFDYWEQRDVPGEFAERYRTTNRERRGLGIRCEHASRGCRPMVSEGGQAVRRDTCSVVRRGRDVHCAVRGSGRAVAWFGIAWSRAKPAFSSQGRALAFRHLAWLTVDVF